MSIPAILGEGSMWHPGIMDIIRTDGIIKTSDRPNVLIPFVKPTTLSRPPDPRQLEKAITNLTLETPDLLIDFDRSEEKLIADNY